jgi:hypothetical protein
MVHLNTALSQLQTDLPQAAWVNSFSNVITDDDVDNDQNKLTAELALLSVLNPATTKIYKELNFSVISGECIQDLSSATALISQIETFITSLANFDVAGYPGMTLFSQQVFSESFLQPLRRSLRQYNALISVVNRRISHQAGSSMIFHEIVELPIPSDKVSVAGTLAELFYVNVNISEIDHRLSYNKSTFKRLLLFQNQLTNLSLPSAELELITAKCGFLLYKLSFRLQQSKKRFDYGIDFNYSTVQLTEIPQFAAYNDIIKGHYDKGMNPPGFDSRANAAQTKYGVPANILNLDDYHALIKKYKDAEPDISRLLALKNKYEAWYNQVTNQAISPFDKRAYDIGFCYIENNLFSLELDQKKVNLENWENKLESYTNRATTLNNSNFFPYYKIIDKFLGPEIKRQFKQNDEKGLTVIKELLLKYDDNLKLLILNTGICEETEYIAFQADYNAATTNFIDSQGTSHKCFVSSAFVLPLEYSKFKEELETYRAELTKFRTMYDIQRLLQKDHKAIQKVKEEIDKTDKRHIEILSIFAALVMFVSSEIQIFSKIVYMRDAVTFTLFFAFSLGLFVLMIWFITRPKGIKRKALSYSHMLIFSLFIAGTVLGVVYAFFGDLPKSKTDKQVEKMQKEIKTLRQQISNKPTLIQPAKSLDPRESNKLSKTN